MQLFFYRVAIGCAVNIQLSRDYLFTRGNLDKRDLTLLRHWPFRFRSQLSCRCRLLCPAQKSTLESTPGQTMNRIFGSSSSSSKKPKPTLQDVIDQVGTRSSQRERQPLHVCAQPRVTRATHRRMPARPPSKSRSRSSTASSRGTKSK